MPWTPAHDADDLVAFCLKRLQVVAVDLDGQLALDAADRLLDVVGDGLRKVPDDARHLLEFTIHGADQLVLVLVEDGPPLILRLQVDEIFRIEEAGRVGAVVGPAHLADHVRDLGKGGQHGARFVHDGHALGRPGAGRERAAHPDGAFIQMRKKLRADHAAEAQKRGQSQRAQGRAHSRHSGVRWPSSLPSDSDC